MDASRRAFLDLVLDAHTLSKEIKNLKTQYNYQPTSDQLKTEIDQVRSDVDDFNLLYME